MGGKAGDNEERRKEKGVARSDTGHAKSGGRPLAELISLSEDDGCFLYLDLISGASS